MRRVLSMWQPWATLCVAPQHALGIPPKQHETRAFAPRIALPIEVVIHATKKWDRDNVWTGPDPEFREALTRCGFLAGPATKAGVFRDQSLKPLPLGAIIGVATIVAVESTQSLFGDAACAITTYDQAFGDWSPGRYAWRFADTALIPEPIPFKGRQDVLYRLDPTIERQVEEQLAGATI